jgi:hypothetical protein
MSVDRHKFLVQIPYSSRNYFLENSVVLNKDEGLCESLTTTYHSYTILFLTKPLHSLSHNTIPNHSLPYHTIPYTYPILPFLHHSILYHTIPYHTISFLTTPYYTITIPYHTILYSNVKNSSAFIDREP